MKKTNVTIVIVSYILKMDESNQYGQAITKPVDNKMGHLFVANIKFDKNKAREREFLFNEIYLPIFRKK